MFVVLRDPLLPPPKAGWVNRVTKSYDDQAVAEAEAERLAREHGGRFLVMEAVAAFAAEVKIRQLYNFQLDAERQARLAAQAERATSGGDGEGATTAELNAELDPDVDRRAAEAELAEMPF